MELCPLKILDACPTHIMKEAKELIKLIVVDSNHFVRYKCKITHCLDSQTFQIRLSNCSWWLFLMTISFDIQSLEFVTMSELKKVYARRFAAFSFLLDSSIQCLFSVGIRRYFTQCDICRKMGQMYLSIVE